MKLNKLYILYLGVFILFIISVTFYFSLSSLDRSLQAKKNEFLSVKNKTSQQEKKAIQLKKFISQNGLQPVNKETAKIIIFSSLNQFLVLYDARVIKPLTEKKGVYTVSISFKYYPESSTELFQFINSLKEQKYPVLMINSFTLENLKEGTIVSFEITMEQPFVE